jgi:hypothetical protein
MAVFFLFASGANAVNIWNVSPGESITDVINNASPGDVVQVNPGAYQEDVQVNQIVILRGLDNPTIANASPGADAVYVSGFGAGSVITGFNITGTPTAVHINGSDGAYDVSLVYNNIYRNGVGLNASGFGLCLDFMPYTLDFWGENGTGPFKGKDSAATITQSSVGVNSKASGKVASKISGKTNGKANSKANAKVNAKANSKAGVVIHRNNGIVGFADNSSWLTAGVINGNATTTYLTGGCENLFLNNQEAGVDVRIDGAIGGSCVVGSAAYLGTPYGPIPSGLGNAVRYVDVFVKGDNVDEARVSIGYTDQEVSDAGVFEDTLIPYVWVGTSWKSASKVTVDTVNKVVSGNFSTLSLSGQPIALIGKTYKVTILPPANPGVPISINPALNITIDSIASIGAVYYQLDGHASNGWKLIEDVGFANNIWQNTSWGISDADWANVTNGTHAFYFNFTRDGLPPVGGNGEISWRFTKGGNPPPVSPIVVTSPKEGDILTRTPWLITWTMPNPENVLSVDLWFARDGNFYMRGGLNNPIHIATLGADTSYLWRSPNFQTDTAKIAVVVIYNDGTQFVGISDNFSLAKGYSFHAYKPTPRTPWQVGSGISRAVAVIGSWFQKPHIPYVIG